MKAHLPTIIISLIFIFSLLAIDSVRAGYPGFSTESLQEAESQDC